MMIQVDILNFDDLKSMVGLKSAKVCKKKIRDIEKMDIQALPVEYVIESKGNNFYFFRTTEIDPNLTRKTLSFLRVKYEYREKETAPPSLK